VIPDDDLILLDTSAWLPWFRGNAEGAWLETTYQLKARPFRPLVSVIAVGEILAFAIRNSYSLERRQKLDKLPQELTVVEVRPRVAAAFARIQATQQSLGLPIGENDTWIAAIAMVTGAVLLTKDKDFDKLPQGLIKLERYDPPQLP
jgi:predicted nucleic acid-binding protein